MTPLLFYLAAAALFGLGLHYSKKTSVHAHPLGRRTRKSLGHFLLFASFIPLVLGAITQRYPGHSADIASSTVRHSTIQAVPIPITHQLREALELLNQKQYASALEKVNAALALEPGNAGALALRGNIYASEKSWDLATKDYQAALEMNSGNPLLKFNLAEVNFMQKKYDAARSDFTLLQQDPEVGDLATYKVFLCDLFGGHEEVAHKELAAINQVGANASYYFANAAWSLHRQDTEDARTWLKSAAHIYYPSKFQLYAVSLADLGYPEKLKAQASALPVTVPAPSTPPTTEATPPVSRWITP